jgi:hypothetical protein
MQEVTFRKKRGGAVDAIEAAVAPDHSKGMNSLPWEPL